MEVALAVLYHFFPEPPLAAYVESFCLFEGDAELPVKERCLPNGRAGMVINLGHDTLRVASQPRGDQLQNFHGGVLSGASSQFVVIDTATMVTTLSVTFKPVGIRPFLQMPATELANQTIDLSTLWGIDAACLREQLLAVQRPAIRFRILQQFLLERIAWEQTPHPAIVSALAKFQAGHSRYAISEVTEQLGLSHKRFINLFGEATGLTPKMYCRVLRFQETLQQIKRGQGVEWADLAISLGYYDQAHFIHDFQAFAGLTPRAYLAQCGEYPNHVPISE